MKKIFISLMLIIIAFKISSQPIIGGDPITISMAPWQVSLKSNFPNMTPTHFSGGVIIAPQWILTAAHSVESYVGSASFLAVHAGVTDQTHIASGQLIACDNIILHPQWNYQTFNYDVALVHLATPLTYNYDVCPIEFANACNIQSGDISPNGQNSATITGWGEVSSTISVSQILQGKSIPIVDRSLAQAIFQSTIGYVPKTITGDMIPFYQYNASAGHGDSGGPAILDAENKGNKILMGVCSWGAPYPATSQAPCVYQFIQDPATTNWIASTTSIYPRSGQDLYMQDKPWDLGNEASSVWPARITEPYSSDDIWVRRQDDGLTQWGYQKHQNPEYYLPSSPNNNYIYVRVRNRGCQATSGTEQLHVYWAKGATALNWSSYWDGSISANNPPIGTVPLGNVIGSVTIPVIQPGHAEILKLPWKAVNPSNYVGLGSNPLFNAEEPWHFCLLARIESPNDPILNETSDLPSNVVNNNNIIWKNVSIVNLDPNNRYNGENEQKYGAAVMVGDVSGNGGVYNLVFCNSRVHKENPVTNEAEIMVVLDDDLWEKWAIGGYQSSGVEILDRDQRKLLIVSDRAEIQNLGFEGNERKLMHVGFHFLVERRTEQSQFHYEVLQVNNENGSLVGGEEYVVNVTDRPEFEADAGGDQEVRPSVPVYLHAEQLAEMALYRWYDMQGNLIGESKDLQVSPSVTQKYKLEVITTADGFKDYDTVEIRVKEFLLTRLYPNPASSSLNVEYDATKANSAYIMLVKHDGTFSNQYVLNTTVNVRQINLSNFPKGLYSAILICDGRVGDYKNFSVF